MNIPEKNVTCGRNFFFFFGEMAHDSSHNGEKELHYCEERNSQLGQKTPFGVTELHVKPSTLFVTFVCNDYLHELLLNPRNLHTLWSRVVMHVCLFSMTSKIYSKIPSSQLWEDSNPQLLQRGMVMLHQLMINWKEKKLLYGKKKK